MSIARLRALAAAALLALSIPGPALADPPTKQEQQEAATRFRKGLDLFKDGDFQAALIEFRRANEIAPNYNVLYNIGQVYFQLQDYPNALTTLERYLSEGGAKIPASRREYVEKDIAKLRARVASLDIASAVEDAEITIDDVSIGRGPFAKPILVSAGRHKITASKAGYVTATKVIEVASGEVGAHVQIDPVLAAPPVATPAATTNDAPAPLTASAAPSSAAPPADAPAPPAAPPGPRGCGACATAAPQGGRDALLALVLAGLALFARNRR